ncbi:PEP/pyruvate-binding domain-containing protein [Paenibacillus allorhizosphaerae]|uniref:Phosphoenolpyruvate synthase n=1 Tax=Paenibacillus allorhizosphaerae TaxID=2849866 RepID=A0ABM8VDQ2_9BACL|nr:PEP/pyruvate-binding domain-containing protein [Paenibacillus allorhizosphaerae]CAG7626624.1 hypothetical protein PAECIP111802_01270 [Paenibacillus allorhizosphaerae]
MVNMIKSFNELTPEYRAFAGGKGGMLALMYQQGYPVPEGFVVLPKAFQDGELRPSAWTEIQARLNTIRSRNTTARFAVRSSALSEDSAQASFAGEFETVLNTSTDESVRDAIDTVYASRESERVKAYSIVQGIDQSHQIAVVVQLMVPSEISGVLFTADPVTGSYRTMTGNYVYGLGEQLVSGESNAESFSFARPKGIYNGPNALKRYANQLFSIAAKLEKDLDGPQDIEWAVARGKLYILQARPITTLSPGNPDTFEWNDSLTGDFLWTNTNVGEAMSDVFTPLSWSIIRMLDEEQSPLPGYYLMSGNICGRVYSNISIALSLYPVFGKDAKSLLKKMSNVFGQFPEEATIPVFPFTRYGLIKSMVPKIMYRMKKMRDAFASIPDHLKETPDWCKEMTVHIGNAQTKEQLLEIWNNQLYHANIKALWVALAGGRKIVVSFKLKEKLSQLVGSEDATTLLSNLRGTSGLASLGPLVGISKIIKGQMSREQYLMQYGHRGPHEFELSIPHPGEERSWLEKQIAEFQESNTDVETLLAKQHAQYEEAWERVLRRYPDKADRIAKKIAQAAEYGRLREAVRSEWTRVLRVNRAFALKAGEFAGIGEDIFFLYLSEVLQVLAGNESAVKHIPARQNTYERYKSLPPFPSIIRGRFDPANWAQDPNRRLDFYDPSIPATMADSVTLTGFAGAAGKIEGCVRVLSQPEEGEQLLPGEILVASTTNVGWTPLFPRAAAIITDIGAPLSHAAIVARELGIPAVVGCGNATAKLRTGDRVIVDGAQGKVHIIPN